MSMFKLIKGILLGLVFSILFVFSTKNQVFAVESINSFYSIIEVNQDTSLTITEQIDYNTTLEKHGIYRYIPIRYNKGGQVEVLQIFDISVSDDRGNSIPYTRSSDGTNVTLKIGDPDSTFSGQKNYVIRYTVERGITQFESHDELYWDITGEGWQIPILQSSASVISKYAPIQQADCFSGQFGGNDGLCNFEIGENQAVFSYLEQITYGENMTIVLSFPKDSQLIFPTQVDLFFLWLKHNWSLVFLPVPILVLFVWWYRKGRDFEFISQNVFDLDEGKPSRLRPIQFGAREPMVYEPLKSLSPGEAGALIDEKVDVQDIVAEILELARKKYLKIAVTEKKVFFSTTREYEFTKISDVASNQSLQELTPVQEYLHTQLFKTGDIVKLSSLKGTFYTVIATAQTKLETALVAKNAYTSKPTTVRAYGMIVFILLLGGVFGVLSITVFPLGIVWPIFFLIIQIPFGLMLGYNLAQKSAVGTNLWLQSRGLRATIKRGAWREKIKEKNLFIEEVLPFAVALGVVTQLAKDMDDLQIKPPEYISGAHLTSWSMANFVSGFSQEVGTSLAYNPSSSSSSGGSGFSGGSSGGGGGGGGGGSW